MHMARAHLSSELKNVLLNLDWVDRKLAVMGSPAPAYVLSDYVKYSILLMSREVCLADFLGYQPNLHVKLMYFGW